MPLTALDHLLVLSEDVEATRDFYSEMLGLRVGERPPLEFPGYWLYAGEEPCLHIAERAAYVAHAETIGLAAGAVPEGGGAIDHVAFSADDYEEIAARLQAAGVDVVENVVPGAGLRQLFVDDPNGVRIEINVGATERSEGKGLRDLP
jgi:catechol 2,3-dioxygenase-like lactoylglutathione lyase family enzyme